LFDRCAIGCGDTACKGILVVRQDFQSPHDVSPRRWNEALQSVAKIEGEISATIALRPSPLSEQERKQLMALGADIERAWSHPAATAATRKRILRAALSVIIVRRDGALIHAVLHWQGGDHTELSVKQRLNAAGRPNPRMPDETKALIGELARLTPDQQRARLLNRVGVETGYVAAISGVERVVDVKEFGFPDKSAVQRFYPGSSPARRTWRG
jgi:hypothetical protein